MRDWNIVQVRVRILYAATCEAEQYRRKAAAPGCALRSAHSRTYATRHIAHGWGMASPVCHAAYAGAYVNRHYGSWAGLKAFRPTWARFSRTRESGGTVQSERSADVRISISRVFVWNSRDIEKKV